MRTGGAKVVIEGVQLAGDGLDTTITIGGQQCDSVVVTSSSKVGCLAPPGVGANLPILLSVSSRAASALSRAPSGAAAAGGRGDGGRLHDVPLQPAHRDRALPRRALHYGVRAHARGRPRSPQCTRQGFALTIVGTDLGYDGVNISVFSISVGNQPCASLTFINDTAIVCAVPPGVGADLAVAVSVADQPTSTPSLTFSYPMCVARACADVYCSAPIASAPPDPPSPTPRCWVCRLSIPRCAAARTSRALGDRRADARALQGGDIIVFGVRDGLPAPPTALRTGAAAPSHRAARAVTRGLRAVTVYIGAWPCVATTWLSPDAVACTMPEGAGS